MTVAQHLHLDTPKTELCETFVGVSHDILNVVELSFLHFHSFNSCETFHEISHDIDTNVAEFYFLAR